jgi:hypothetical protein
VQIILPLTTDFPVQNLRIFVQDKTGDAATNPIVISTQGSDLINGGASFTINTAYGFARIQIGAEGLYTVTAANTPGSGGNLWRFKTAPPVTDIMLNDLAGVTGIAAPLPGYPSMNLLFQEFAPGTPFGGFICYVTPTKFVGNLTDGIAGQEAASLAALDLVSGAEASYNAYIDGLGNPATGGFVSDGVSAVNENNASSTNYIRRIEDESIFDKVEVEQTNTAFEVRVFIAGTEEYRVRIDANEGLKITDPGGVVLNIGASGEILTNQTQAATATDTTIVGRFPVYDEGGILIGYAPLMIDP